MKTIFQTCRQGFSLLEVLVSVFVVLIGLLGVATMIPAGRYEILQARKADMGADLSRAIMNSVVTQISNGWDPKGGNYFAIANDNGELARRLGVGLQRLNLTALDNQHKIFNDRMFNGDDDVAIIEGDDNKMQIMLDNGELIGTGVYTSCATIVSLGNGYYEVTGVTVYRYEEGELGTSDFKSYQQGSYAFMTDDSGKNRWYKIENIYNARQPVIVTSAGEKRNGFLYLGEVVGICRKVVRIDTYEPTAQAGN